MIFYYARDNVQVTDSGHHANVVWGTVNMDPRATHTPRTAHPQRKVSHFDAAQARRRLTAEAYIRQTRGTTHATPAARCARCGI